MKILIIGGVAAGTKTAAKLKRADRSAEVTVLTKGKDISYAGCGLPYYVGGLIEERSELIVNTPQKFAALTGVNVDASISTDIPIAKAFLIVLFFIFFLLRSIYYKPSWFING